MSNKCIQKIDSHETFGARILYQLQTTNKNIWVCFLNKELKSWCHDSYEKCKNSVEDYAVQ